MSLLSLVLAAAVGQAIPPPELVHPDELPAYRAWRDATELANARAADGPGCVSVTTKLSGVAGPLTDLHVQGAENLFEGPIYRESYVADGCGRPVLRNLMVLRKKSGGWQGVALLPGRTITSFVLQRDALRSATAAAMLPIPKLDCPGEEMGKTFKVLDTQVVSGDRPAPPYGQWVERWTQTVCGQDRSVDIRFVRSTVDGGTDLSVKALWPGGERIGGGS